MNNLAHLLFPILDPIVYFIGHFLVDTFFRCLCKEIDETGEALNRINLIINLSSMMKYNNSTVYIVRSNKAAIDDVRRNVVRDRFEFKSSLWCFLSSYM